MYYITRRIINDGAKYFGPYANAGAAKEMMDFIKERFKIRQCKKFKYKKSMFKLSYKKMFSTLHGICI